MLIMGSPQCIQPAKDFFKDLILLNYNSYIIGFPDSGIMPSPIPIQQYNDYEFDIAYADYIIRNDNVFCSFFNNIINPLQSGSNVFMISDNSNYEINLPESLLKLIQQRYGYNGSIINEPVDICTISESSFSIPGLYNFDQDMIRYCEIMNIPAMAQFSE